MIGKEGNNLDFDLVSWMYQIDRRPLKESVLELLNAALRYKNLPVTEENYQKVKNLLFHSEALQWVPGGADYLTEGYKKDKEVADKFKELHNMLREMEQELFQDEPGIAALHSEDTIRE